MSSELEYEAHRVSELAQVRGVRVALAESCTSGLAAAMLSRVPGASNWFCGSTVVYRNATKTAWLGVSAEILDDPQIGPVSAETAEAMAAGVLRITPEADLAVSVTGHLGPDAPPELNGVVFVGAQRRSDGDPWTRVERFVLAPSLPDGSPHAALRLHRQHEATLLVLRELAAACSWPAR